MNKKCIYTTIFDNYDMLRSPSVISKGWDYICFTDSCDLSSAIWDVRKVECDKKLTPSLNNRKIKILEHKYIDRHYDLSVYIDGKIKINCDLDIFLRQIVDIDNHKDKNLILPFHPRRSCVYQEFFACIRRNVVDAKKAYKLLFAYLRDGYPMHNGLHSCTMLIRNDRMNENMLTFMEIWFEAVKNIGRDQLCFDYLAWKHNDLLKIHSFSHRYITGYKGDYFIQYTHGMQSKENRL